MFSIAQILRNAPKGLKLYSPIFGDCEFDGVNEKDEIRIRSLYKVCCSDTERSYLYILNDAGQLHPSGEVMLYPNSIMKEWKGWQEILFKKGDVITNNITKNIYIFNDRTHAIASDNYNTEINATFFRYATDDERKDFFEKLKSYGFVWNKKDCRVEKVKTCCTCSNHNGLCLTTFDSEGNCMRWISERKGYTPKFKVGDIVKSMHNSHLTYKILKIIGPNELDNVEYRVEIFVDYKPGVNGDSIGHNIQNIECHKMDEWGKLVFCIDYIKPFDKVLARDYNSWSCALYSHNEYETNENDGTQELLYVTSNGFRYHQCVPFDDTTKHLLGTNKDYEGVYKLW